jgi:hypothetical protein
MRTRLPSFGKRPRTVSGGALRGAVIRDVLSNRLHPRPFVFRGAYMRILFSACSCLLVVASATQAFSQPLGADRKITGEVYRPYSARTYARGAISHGNVLQYYGKNYATVPKETAEEHAKEVRRNLDAFGKELAKLEAESKNDAEAMKLITEIRTHHKAAADHCGMLEAECAKHMAAGGVVAKCCVDMLKELRAADEAHDKLLKHLGIPLPGGEQKPGTR